MSKLIKAYALKRNLTLAVRVYDYARRHPFASLLLLDCERALLADAVAVAKTGGAR